MLRGDTALTPQELELLLIRQASFNNFDGNQIADNLEARPDLWKAALVYQSSGPGITLRDLPDGDYNIDMLVIYPKPGKDHDLEVLSQDWKPDETSWEGRDFFHGSNSDYRALKLWWD